MKLGDIGILIEPYWYPEFHLFNSRIIFGTSPIGHFVANRLLRFLSRHDGTFII